jgi:thiol-disulfide isomerase/thioredoxin
MTPRILEVILVALMCTVPLTFGDTQPTTGPALSVQNRSGTEAPAIRNATAIESDLQNVSAELGRVLPPPQSMIDPAVRAKAAPVAILTLWKMVHLLDEAVVVSPQSKDNLLAAKYRFLGTLSLLDDAQAQKILETDAASTQKEVALSAFTAELSTKWLKNNTDGASQSNVLDNVERITLENPSSNVPAVAAFTMSQVGAASADLSDRAKKIALVESTSPFTKQRQKLISDEAKLFALENKPLEIKGTNLMGKEFSSTEYKGKVVLVDFWATWCGPCKAELPRVKNLYKQYHDRGLEIIGVSCDVDGDALKDFLKADPDMSWVELYESGAKFNPLAVQYGVDFIPRMLLIDRNGVCRSVEAREKMEQLLPTLLAEEPTTKPASAN